LGRHRIASYGLRHRLRRDDLIDCPVFWSLACAMRPFLPAAFAGDNTTTVPLLA
jgi:hypothetical protein